MQLQGEIIEKTALRPLQCNFYFWNCTGVDKHFLIKEDIIIYLTKMSQIDHEKIITQYILLKSTQKYLDEQAARKCPV